MENAINDEQNPDSYNVLCSNIEFFAPKKEGYAFKGWYLDDNYLQEKRSIESGSTGNIVVYAKWKANTYNVKFVENGGTEVEDVTVVFDSYLDLPITERRGYTFSGWYGVNKIESGIWKIPNDVVLNANW